MRFAALLLAALTLAAAPAGAQAWSYPRAGRANPVAPPRELYGEAVPRIRVTTILRRPGAAALAVVRVGVAPARRHLAREGSAVGPLRVVRIRDDGVDFSVRVLGTPRHVFVPKSGARAIPPASAS